MNKTAIEWVQGPDGKRGFTWSPITGCSGCEIMDKCYAFNLAHTRLKGRFGYPSKNPFKPTYHPDRMKKPFSIRNPSGIFVCSMGEIFDQANEPAQIRAIIDVMRRLSKHRFYILTKQPQLIPLHNAFRFPENVWLGVSVTGQSNAPRVELLKKTRSPGIKFVSFEPLLSPIDFVDLDGIDWVIIGGCTGVQPSTPHESWVKSLISMARIAGASVFLKNNLRWPTKIQEFPDK